MLPRIPLIHAVHRFRRLPNREHRPFRELIEMLVGHDRRNLDNRVVLRAQARHLEIDPDQVCLLRSLAGVVMVHAVYTPAMEHATVTHATYSRRMRLRTCRRA